jgi:hypothetical protein
MRELRSLLESGTHEHIQVCAGQVAVVAADSLESVSLAFRGLLFFRQSLKVSLSVFQPRESFIYRGRFGLSGRDASSPLPVGLAFLRLALVVRAT